MQAVILAAGNSNRFYPFNSLGHKSLAKMMGKTLLEHTLDALQKSNVHEVYIVVGQDSTIQTLLENYSTPDFNLRFIVQKEKLGMGHALLQVKKYLNNSFFLLSGYHAEISDFADQLLDAQYDPKNVVLLAKEDQIVERYGVVEVKGSTVLRVKEKPSKNAAYPLRVIGMYLLPKDFLDTLEKTPVEHYHFEKALDSYAKEGKVVWTKAEKPTFTLKYGWDLLDAKDYFLSKIKPYISEKAIIAKNVLMEGNVHISDGAKVLEGVCIKGPCFLGENVIVGNNAILRGGVVAEKDAVIGATMEVKNSFLAEGVTTHTGFIGDSIIGPFSRLAAGFCSANVRFDRGFITSNVRGEEVNSYKTHLGTLLGSHVDSGTNVSTMPGIIIGNHVTIGPSTTVMENVEDNTLMYTKFETIKKKVK